MYLHTLQALSRYGSQCIVPEMYEELSRDNSKFVSLDIRYLRSKFPRGRLEPVQWYPGVLVLGPPGLALGS